MAIINKLLIYSWHQLNSGKVFQFYKYIIFYFHKIQFKECGTNVSIHPNVEIRNHENIVIGNNVSINHNSELYGGGGIEIGDGTMLSYYVTVLSDSRSFMGEDPLKSPNRLSERIYKKTIIGKDVWIGTKATIMPGVRIHDHAIVATGAVVTKEVMEWEIVGGNPAKHIGNRRSVKK